MEKLPVNLKAASCELARSGFELHVGVLMGGEGDTSLFKFNFQGQTTRKYEPYFPRQHCQNMKKENIGSVTHQLLVQKG